MERLRQTMIEIRRRGPWPVRGLLLLGALCILGACQERPDDDFAVSVPSAIVEMPEDPSPAELAAETRVVVLGTGTPLPDAYRAGPSIAVVHRGQSYLFDVGAGSVRNATVARYKYDIPSLYPLSICCLFLTHMHNDHTIDYPELVFTMWWRGREPLRVWGPPGIHEMTDGMYAMMAPDIRARSSGSLPIEIAEGYRTRVTEVTEGTVLEQDGLKVEAFAVNHGDGGPAFGYRITTEDKTIVISGDTAYSPALLEMARGADLLFHEVISDSGLLNNSEAFQAYHRSSHTTASELGRLASEARPGLLVLYHGLYYGTPENRILDEVSGSYDGPIALAGDLDVF